MPHNHGETDWNSFHGYAARISLTDFSGSGVEYVNLGNTHTLLRGFDGGFVAGGFAYFVPVRRSQHHEDPRTCNS